MHGPHNWIGQDDLVATWPGSSPHLICIAGDAVDDRGDEPLVSALRRPPRAASASSPRSGNWEYQGECDLRRLAPEYERAGVRLLVNDRCASRTPPDRSTCSDSTIGGLAAPDYAQVATLPQAVVGAPRAIVMSHCPVAFDAIVRIAHRPTVVLSGHTHGGQIAPFGLALVLPEGSGNYARGTYTSADQRHTMYVSRGLGNSGPPFRIGATPELALLTV